MPKFSTRSKNKLAQAHPDIQRLMEEVIKHVDIIVIETHRGKVVQNEYFATGRSKLKWPNSKHNSDPSDAIDIAPWDSVAKGIDWDNRDAFHYPWIVTGKHSF